MTAPRARLLQFAHLTVCFSAKRLERKNELWSREFKSSFIAKTYRCDCRFKLGVNVLALPANFSTFTLQLLKRARKTLNLLGCVRIRHLEALLHDSHGLHQLQASLNRDLQIIETMISFDPQGVQYLLQLVLGDHLEIRFKRATL